MQVIYSIANRAIASDWLTEFKDQFFDLSLKQLLLWIATTFRTTSDLRVPSHTSVIDLNPLTLQFGSSEKPNPLPSVM